MVRRDGGGRHAASTASTPRAPRPAEPAVEQVEAVEPSAQQVEAVEPSAQQVEAVEDSGILEEQLILQARRRPRRMARVPKLVGEALALVWTTSRIGTFNVVAVQFVSAGVAAVQVLVGGYAVGRLVAGGRNFDVGSVLPPLILLAVVTMIGSLGTSGMSQLGRVLGIQVQGAVQARVLDVTTGVDLVAFDDPAFHDQLQRVNANVPTQPYNVVSATASLVGGVVGAVSLVVTLAVIQPVLVVLLLIAGPPLWWLSRRGGDLEFSFATVQAEPFRERAYVVDTLTRRDGAGEVRAFRTAAWLRRRWATSYQSFVDDMRRHVRRRYLLNAASTLATGAVTILTLVVLVVLVDHGRIGVGGAASAAVAIRLLASRLQQLFGGLSTLFQASVFLEDFQEFLGRSGDRRLRIGPAAAPGPATPVVAAPVAADRGGFGGVTVRDTSFRYPSSDVDAVRGVSLDLRPGEIVALVGENGSGKTTLAKLLAGLYAPTTGEVCWSDGAGELPLAGPAGAAARDRIGLVLQDFQRYQLSAADNIVLGRPELPPDRDRVETAAARVNADEFLAALPFGYDTRLSREFRGGRELSQGQWQRVALARVFYRDSDLVILDEPTAALDPRAEHQLFRSVREVLAGRTVVLITHRLQSVREADRIIVMRDGEVTEQGDHAALMAAGGLYAELVGLQARGMLTGAADGPGGDPAGSYEDRTVAGHRSTYDEEQ